MQTSDGCSTTSPVLSGVKDPLPRLLFWWRRDPVMQVVLMFWLNLKSVTLHNAHFNPVALKHKWGQNSSGFKLERVVLGHWTLYCGPCFYRSVCCCHTFNTQRLVVLVQRLSKAVVLPSCGRGPGENLKSKPSKTGWSSNPALEKALGRCWDSPALCIRAQVWLKLWNMCPSE